MEIIPGIYQLQIPIPDNPLGHLNSYLLEGINGWLIIDTGWHDNDAFNSLETQLNDVGLAIPDIATIIVTHVHPDHFGLAGRIKQLSPQTELMAHFWESNFIESRYIKSSELRDKMATMLLNHGVPPSILRPLQSASMPTLNSVNCVLPDRILYGGETITTGIYNLEIIWTPGHSSGHICLYEPRNRLLFVGDHILPVTTPNVSYHVQSGDNPLGDFLYALRKIQNIPVAMVLPAHEHIFTDLRGRIEEIVRHHNKRNDEIRQVIAEKPHSAYTIASSITWDIPDLSWEQFTNYLKGSAVMETIAHLEYMRWKGTVIRLIEDQSVLYKAL